MTDADILRGLTAPVTILALHAGADALDDTPRLRATIAGLEETRDALVATVATRDAEIERLRALLPPAPRFPGDPGPGRIYLGASAYHNGLVTGHEAATGKPLPVRRRFYADGEWDPQQSQKLLAAVKEDHAAGRLPWVSFKFDWSAAAAGRLDAAIDRLIRALHATSKPVILTAGHEPENDGQPASLYRAAQERIADRLNALGRRNITFVGVLMTWTWDSRSGRTPADWIPKPGVWDLFGGDHYTPDPKTSWDRPNWQAFLGSAQKYGAPVAIGEFGFQATDPQRPEKIRSFVDELVRVGCPVACYFNSTANSGDNNWLLTGTSLGIFHGLLTDSRIARL